jgi:site-specific DNA-methyltransferase (adenine-specific)
MSLYYQDDYVTLFHGDCLTDHREWLYADVLVTDPPYGMDFTGDFRSRHGGKRGGKTQIAGDTSTEARDKALAAWAGKPGLVFGTWRVPRPAQTKNVLVWDKGDSPGVGNTNIPWGFSHEEIYVTGIWPERSAGHGGNRMGSVLRHATLARLQPGSGDRPPLHPTPKPVPLMERLIEKCPDGTITDPFAGAGATLVAAKNLGRKVVGVELEERYCEIIAKRCAQDVLDIFGSVA